MDAITYALSKKYTDNKIAESAALHREIVTSLPATGDDTTIYMVLDQTASEPDIYDEWMWINGAYEHIGSTRVDLTDYYNKTQVDTALSGKQDTLSYDNVPTQGSSNPVISGGIFSTMAVPKYDAANRREYYEGGGAFGGNIDSTPTAGSNNAVASGGTKNYVDNAVSGLVKLLYVTGTTSVNGNIQFSALSKSSAIVLGCQFKTTSGNAVVAIPYSYSSNLVTGYWGAHVISEYANNEVIANTNIEGYVYYIEKRAYTS